MKENELYTILLKEKQKEMGIPYIFGSKPVYAVYVFWLCLAMSLRFDFFFLFCFVFLFFCFFFA